MHSGRSWVAKLKLIHTYIQMDVSAVSAHLVMRGFSTFGLSAHNTRTTVKRTYTPCISTRLPIFLYVCVCVWACACMSGWLTGWLSISSSTSPSYFLARSLRLCIQKTHTQFEASVSTAVNYFIYYFLFVCSMGSFHTRLLHTHTHRYSISDRVANLAWIDDHIHVYKWNTLMETRCRFAFYVCTLLYYSQQINSC